MMRYYFLFLLYFLNLIILKSQGENDNWIFGNGCVTLPKNSTD